MTSRTSYYATLNTNTTFNFRHLLFKYVNGQWKDPYFKNYINRKKVHAIIHSHLFRLREREREREETRMQNGDGETTPYSLFETREGRRGGRYRAFAATVMAGIAVIWGYRAAEIPTAGDPGRWPWIGIFISEILFGLYWILTQSLRWRLTYNFPFKDQLSLRYSSPSRVRSVFNKLFEQVTTNVLDRTIKLIQISFE